MVVTAHQLTTPKSAPDLNGSGGRLILAGGLNILISTSAKSVICPLKYPPRKEANHGNYNEWKNVSQMFSLYYENN